MNLKAEIAHEFCAIETQMAVTFPDEGNGRWRKSMAHATQRLVATRGYNHRTFGQIGTVELVIDNAVWFLDGKEIPKVSREYLLNFALQSLQDAYAGSENLTEATAAFEKKRDAILAGTIGVRGETVNETVHVARIIVRRYLKLVKKPIPETDAEIDVIFEKNAKVFGPMVEEELARRKAVRDGAAALAGLDIDI